MPTLSISVKPLSHGADGELLVNGTNPDFGLGTSNPTPPPDYDQQQNEAFRAYQGAQAVTQAAIARTPNPSGTYVPPSAADTGAAPPSSAAGAYVDPLAGSYAPAPQKPGILPFLLIGAAIVMIIALTTRKKG